jgi:hypothetical protein
MEKNGEPTSIILQALTARLLALWRFLFGIGDSLGWFALKFWLPVNHRSSGSHSASQAQIYEAYIGSASCRECHPEAFKKWAGSRHAEAERLIQTNRDQTEFAPAREFKHGRQKSFAMWRDG